MKIVLCLSAILMLLPTLVLSEETYKFERMWPTLQQPWYFRAPQGLVVDSTKNVYVADTLNCRIQKLTSDGRFITKWGNHGSGDGEFNNPPGIAMDESGNIYVADLENHRIQKFTPHAQFVTKWGSQGFENGQFNYPVGIAVDGSGNVYVADGGNHRIQKFSSDGEFIANWGSQGFENGQFNYPVGIAIDGSDNVYVADRLNNRIQKFTSNGEFITKWGNEGAGDGEFAAPWGSYGYADGDFAFWGIAVDGSGNIYVVDTFNKRIQKFTSDGQFIMKWGGEVAADWMFDFPVGITIDSNGNAYVSDFSSIQKFRSDGQFIAKWGGDGRGDGEFYGPAEITVDASGDVYVADPGNDRIQKFTSDGTFITKWERQGSGDGELGALVDIAVNSSGSVYSTNADNNCIHKYTSEGQFIMKWGSKGSGNGEFNAPQGIAVNGNGDVYVVDRFNYRIQKLTSDGQFITKWGGKGTKDGQFGTGDHIGDWQNGPHGIAIDGSGNVYVADTDNSRIQKFTSDGEFITKWGSEGSDDGEFGFPLDIAVDASGDVYVADTGNNRIQKFNSDGEFITKLGEHGSDPGQVSGLWGLSVGPKGKIYIADTFNSRIQVFSQEGPVSDTSKAIIVAGGGPFPGNNLWDATQMCANFAYRALTYQGFTKDTIYYLSSDTDLDLDGNGILDDVDADATNANLEYAIKTWASDAQDLFLYMVDHGGNGTFRMSGTELLYATNLDAWLDTIQETLPGCVTMVYDACESGSFLPYLLPPAGKQRILATSTSSGEESIFVGNGTVSFSFLFWGHMFNGDSFYDAFVNAKQSVSTTYNLTPQLDGDGNGIGNEKADKDVARLIKVGNETKSAGDVPVIGGVSPAQSLQGTTSATIYAEQVTDANGISRVWAVITPPDYSPGTPDTPVTDLPTIDLISVGNSRYEGTYTNFTSSGTYNIAVFAMDRKGVLSLPVQTTATVTTASSCLAVAKDLSIRVPCAEYDGTGYGFTLVFYRNPDDPSGYYWTLPMATLTTGEGGDCLSIGPDLSMPISCAAYNGTQYGFTLTFYNNPYDPSGLYWKMDMSTLEVK